MKARFSFLPKTQSYDLSFKNREAFYRNTIGAFRPQTVEKKQYTETQTLIEKKSYTKAEIFEAAWQNYSRATKASSDKAAILFYGTDFENFLQTLMINNDLHNEHSLHDKGRVYILDPHTWSINASWLLAQLHKSRGIVAISDGAPNSTFSRELACLYKAGYTIKKINYINSGQSLVHFAPPAKEQAKKVTLGDFLSVTRDESNDAVKQYQTDKQKLIVKARAKSLKQHLRNLGRIGVGFGHVVGKPNLDLGKPVSFLRQNQPLGSTSSFFHPVRKPAVKVEPTVNQQAKVKC